MAPSDVSSIVLKYDTAKASGIISTVVDNLPGYGNVGQAIHLGAIISSSLTAEPLRIEDLVHPPPRAYYLRPEGAPGCGSLVHSPRCGTIFEGDYRAIISLPSEVSDLQGAWKTCNPAIYGVYDPPIALTERASVAKPTLPPGVTAPAYETPAPKGRPYTITPPLATPARTALRDTLPSATNGGNTLPGPTLPAAAPKSGGNGNGNSGQPGASSSGQDQNSDRPGASSNGGQSGTPSNGQDRSGDREGASSNDGQPGAPSSEQGQSGGGPGASSNGQDQSGGRPGASSDSGPNDNAEGTTIAGGTTLGGGSDSDGSGTATSNRGSSDHNTAASSNTATADRSGSRQSGDASSRTSTSESASTRFSAYGTLSAGVFLLVLVF